MASVDETTPAGRAGRGLVGVAAIASLAAGAIHATAAGAHSEHRAAVIAFALTAAAQLGWGGWALGRTGWLVGLSGAAVNGAALGGWLLAKTSGISFVAGLDAVEPVQFADGLAAAFAAVAVIAALIALDRRLSAGWLSSPLLTGAAALAAVGLVVPGMVATSNHSHADGHTHDSVATQLAVPYTGQLPVDLSGVPGVTDAQVAAAEDLVTRTILELPKFADIPTDEALGYRSIGDAGTGFEHFIKWDYIIDDKVLDPDYPESLVFQVDRATGRKTLAAAMFMANPGTTLDTVPDVGGALMQWHIHDNLCFAGQAGAYRVAGVTGPDGKCRPGTVKLGGDVGVPMIHVWITANACGPFAALEGVGAGQIKPGEERLCDHVHGSPTAPAS